MKKEEIAMQITLKALEVGAIRFSNHTANDPNEQREHENSYNADQIINFYTKIIKMLTN